MTSTVFINQKARSQKLSHVSSKGPEVAQNMSNGRLSSTVFESVWFPFHAIAFSFTILWPRSICNAITAGQFGNALNCEQRPSGFERVPYPVGAA